MKLVPVTDKDIDKSLLRDLVGKDDPLILEIGCYDGKDTKDFLDKFKNANLYAFDVDPRSIDLFYQKSDKLIQERVRFNQIALSNIDGEVQWFASNSVSRRHYEDQNSWSASSSIKKPKDSLQVFKDITYTSAGFVKSARLDTWAKNNICNQIVDLIWADVNGAERDFILGSRKTLSQTRFFYTEFSKTATVQLYEGAISRNEILELLPEFEEIGVFSYMGNYGNTLLRNKNF